MKFTKGILATLFVISCGSNNPSSISSQDQFPTMPDDSMTPGSLCSRPTERRYPEQIAYCKRNVASQTKRNIIRTYDETFGYQIESMNRAEFKIDHLIPLCMGGSNEVDNLWPQHSSVYMHTDLLEQRLCEIMARGELHQAKAVEVIRQAKHDFDFADRLRDALQSNSSMDEEDIDAMQRN
ncbi:MAG: HNH endonuclease signature motif containing protein [Oligoflexales bacterium]